MAVERGQVLEIALEQFRHYQNRVVFYLTAGFVVGFVIGLGAAWSLMHLYLE
jgi:hypothetical protein